MNYTGKYFFVSNVRKGDEVSAQMLGYDTEKESEIKFYDEVSYGLKLDTITLAHYEIRNEYGVVVDNLSKTIDNIPTPEE